MDITFVRRVRALILTVVVECVQFLQDGMRFRGIRVLTHCGSQQLVVAARVKKCEDGRQSAEKKRVNRVKKCEDQSAEKKRVNRVKKSEKDLKKYSRSNSFSPRHVFFSMIFYKIFFFLALHVA